LRQYLVKGKQIAVSGRIQQRSYQMPEETKKRSVVEIVAQNVQLLGGGQGGGGAGYNRTAPAAVQPDSPGPEVMEESYPAEYDESPLDDGKNEGIPF
jgi:single-strand DNA-binding protein